MDGDLGRPLSLNYFGESKKLPSLIIDRKIAFVFLFS